MLAGTREAVELSRVIGAGCLTLRSDLPAPARVVHGPFDAAIAGPWRAIICGAHPFDPAALARVQDQRPDLPVLAFRRPAWQPQDGLDWVSVRSVADAVAKMPPAGVVFAATGREGEGALAAYDGQVLLRQNALHNEPPAAPNITFQFGTRSFDVDAEAELFQALGITLVLARNLGGSGGLGKLHAATRLGIPMFMLERPPLAQPIAESIAQTQAWVGAL